MGNIIKNVLESFFAMADREKLLGSRSVKMYVLDDEYNVFKARENVSRLIKDHDIQALLMPVGSANLQGYLDMVNAGQVVVLFAQADSPAFRKSNLKNILNFSASSFEVGYLTLSFAYEKSAIKKLILFYEAVTGGILEGAKRAAAEHNIQGIKEVAFTAMDVNYSEQVKTIKNESPDAIMFFSGITPALSLVRLLGLDYLIDKTLIGGSAFLNVDSLKKNLHEKGLNMIIPSLVPNPKKDDLPIVKDFRAFALSNNIPEEPVALQAYIGARIFVEIVKKIEGPVTKQKIIQVAEQFKHFDLGGIDLTFNPQTRSLINTIWIDDGSEQWQKESIGEIVQSEA
jgi:ABC-type branched-subunit amino acid transport system substrate-binding protein